MKTNIFAFENWDCFLVTIGLKKVARGPTRLEIEFNSEFNFGGPTPFAAIDPPFLRLYTMRRTLY